MPKICTCCSVSEAKLYLYHSTRIAKARPGFDDWPEYPSIQINSSSPCPNLNSTYMNVEETIECYKERGEIYGIL